MPIRPHLPPEVDREVHPDDGMWQPGERWYFRTGRSALRMLQLAVAASWMDAPRSILDLPCGHGRVGRWIQAAWPDSERHFCDIDHAGADFCAARFGGQAIHSRPELTEVELPMVDLIWVGSLFTHVDLDRTLRWMRHLAGRLNPGGQLVASFHGNWSRRMHAIYPAIEDPAWRRIVEQCDLEGYGYAPYSHSPLRDYGVSLTRPGFVCDLVDQIAGVRIKGFYERGWGDNHDVVVVGREDRDAPWTPDFPDWRWP